MIMNNKVIEIAKFVSIYIYKYTGMWCIVMGYVVLFALIAFNDLIGFEELRAIGMFIAMLVIIISLFAEEEFEKNVYKSFGVWW